MQTNDPNFRLRLAVDPVDLRAAQRLRYQVFAKELGATGDSVDHEARLERDQFDAHCDHLVLEDTRRSKDDLDHIVGVYRLLQSKQARNIGGFYSEAEYDLSLLKRKDLKVLELGRSCLHADYRGGAAMFHMWSGLTQFSAEQDIDVLFGMASFAGTSPQDLRDELSFLHHRHLAPEPLRVRSKQYQNMDLVAEAQIDRVGTMRKIPALIKAYLRLGGVVGDGAFVDHSFNTTDVCLLLDRDHLSKKHYAIYGGKS